MPMTVAVWDRLEEKVVQADCRCIFCSDMQMYHDGFGANIAEEADVDDDEIVGSTSRVAGPGSSFMSPQHYEMAVTPGSLNAGSSENQFEKEEREEKEDEECENDDIDTTLTTGSMGSSSFMIGESFVQGSQDETTENRSVKEEFLRFFQVLLGALFSLVGLSGVVGWYIVIGALLFEYIERSYEMEVKRSFAVNRDLTLESIWNVTSQLLRPNALTEKQWKDSVIAELRHFKRTLHGSFTNGWDASSNFDAPTAWTFNSALLFCVNAVSTIGYGNTTPKTKLGRYTTIVYATCGIPLYLVWLKSCGSTVAVTVCEFHRQSDKKIRKRLKRSTRWAALTACCVPSKTKNREEVVRVPLYSCVVLICIYIMLGALQFDMLENWSFVESIYFCFVTLTSIGFGDYVPGVAYGKTTDKEMKVIIVSLYLVFGMIVIAMCFELMKEEVKIKFNALLNLLEICCRRMIKET